MMSTEQETTTEEQQVTDLEFNTKTSVSKTLSNTLSELDPKEGRHRGNEKDWLKGVLIAKRDGFSLATNSIGPLWILEVNQPGSKFHGEIFRCFEFLGAEVMMGNPGDGATNLWFHVKTLNRPDGTPLQVAYEVTATEPPMES